MTFIKRWLTAPENYYSCFDCENDAVLLTELAWRFADFSDGKTTWPLDSVPHTRVPAIWPRRAA